MTDFHGSKIIAIPGKDRARTMIFPKTISDALELNWDAQAKPIKRDDVLTSCTSMMDVRLPGGRRSLWVTDGRTCHGPEVREVWRRFRRTFHAEITQRPRKAVGPSQEGSRVMLRHSTSLGESAFHERDLEGQADRALN